MWHIAVQQKERKQLFLFNYFTPGIPKEPKSSAVSARKSLDFRQVRCQTDVAAQHADHNVMTGFELNFVLTRKFPMNAMSQDQIRETILRVLSDVAPNADTQAINPDISFHDQIELDSIDFLRLMMSLEKEANVTIFDFDYPKLSTLKGCERYLVERLAIA